MIAITLSTAKLKPRETGLVPATFHADVQQVVSAEMLLVELENQSW